MLPMNRYALDLHHHSAEALRQLGGEHENGRRALISELGALLNRLPQVVGFKDRDGAPLASDETRAWLAAEVLGGGKSGGGGGGGGGGGAVAPAAISAAPAVFNMAVVAASPPGAEHAQLKALFAANKRDEALRLAAALIQQAASGRDKFLRRLELAETCLDGKDPALARTLFTGLAAEIDALRLDTWEPALAVRGFEGLARSIPKNQPADKPALDAALIRLATLDPLRASTLR
jgi:type VI secretion system protein ImpA